MIHRIFKTDILYTGTGISILNGMLAIDENQRIVEVGLDIAASGVEVEYFEGALCPGFVNTHCHLEISHLKGKVSQKTGIQNFIQELQQVRNASDTEKQEAIVAANEEMKGAGIVAVGDISNGNATQQAKVESSIFYHTFVELFGFKTQLADSIFEAGQQLKASFASVGLKSTIVPHSPYSVSEKLFKNIAGEQENSPISIHNQESQAENDMYQGGNGVLMDMMKKFGNDMSSFAVSGKSSVQTYLNRLPKNNPLLLVHNTFTTERDIEVAEKLNTNLFWCFCPKANLYIENRLPDIPLFLEKKVKCTIGTDSLASNDTLSIWEEIQTIQKQFPFIPLETLVQWGTQNGAEFLGIEKEYGSFEVDKKPGINWLKNGKLTFLV